jgi:ABC-type transport system involved in cytochrome c biogenesis permease component
MNAFNAVFVRDVRVAFRRWSELAYPLIFFLIVVALFPLALSRSHAAGTRHLGGIRSGCCCGHSQRAHSGCRRAD